MIMQLFDMQNMQLTRTDQPYQNDFLALLIIKPYWFYYTGYYHESFWLIFHLYENPIIKKKLPLFIKALSLSQNIYSTWLNYSMQLTSN